MWARYRCVHSNAFSVIRILRILHALFWYLSLTVFPSFLNKKENISKFSGRQNQTCAVKQSHTIARFSWMNLLQADDASILTHLAQELEIFSDLATDPMTDVNSLWSNFKATVTYCMTHFVPLKTKRPQKHNPSITCEVIHAKWKGCIMQSKWNAIMP